jgi:hypothetical protein
MPRRTPARDAIPGGRGVPTMRIHRRINAAAAVPAIALAALAACGCGASDRTTVSLAAATVAPSAGTTVAVSERTPAFLPASDIDRKVGNGFRVALDRLGVMTQPPDQGVDVGQPVPTGQLRAARCFAADPRPAAAAPWRWTCTVRWATVDGARRTTRYVVRLEPTGCFAASAQPARPQVRDTTAGTFSEDPLNTIVGVGRGC